MNNIIKFPDKFNLSTEYETQMDFLRRTNEQYIKANNFLEKKWEEMEQMSLWDRIFNWPY